VRRSALKRPCALTPSASLAIDPSGRLGERNRCRGHRLRRHGGAGDIGVVVRRLKGAARPLSAYSGSGVSSAGGADLHTVKAIMPTIHIPLRETLDGSKFAGGMVAGR
jgi:hypothetical protein